MFKKIYLLLFNRITDAILALDRGDVEQGKAILIRAQQDAEREQTRKHPAYTVRIFSLLVLFAVFHTRHRIFPTSR